ncbi:MAG TPA: ABC transporter permease [Desulfomonilaceae bacterium]|nr:ABC transporter permease [Desulfomonilaceae bacterium]HVN77813.1 ABC transporter permease [Terriglobia bacterium]
MRMDNILHLGVKEFWSLIRDPIMLVLIAYAFTLDIYLVGTGVADTLHQAPIAIVDEDQSPLSQRIVNAFYPPWFLPARMVTIDEMDSRMDAGLDTFALDIPPKFQEDVLAGRAPAVQLNVDANRMLQAFNGSGYVQTIVNGEVQTFLQRYRSVPRPPVDLAWRVRFNPNLDRYWFMSVVKLIDQVTLLAMILTGAALLRERERGTIEHLLVMPVTPFEIMTSKIWSMGLVVVVACSLSLTLVVRGLLSVPIQGSIPLFLCGAAIHLFAATSLGIFLATFAGTMPQFALLLILVLLPLQSLSGGLTPRESMPELVQYVMLGAPTTHFVIFAQQILYRGAGIDVVWRPFLALAVIGAGLFSIALARFRRTVGTMA